MCELNGLQRPAELLNAKVVASLERWPGRHRDLVVKAFGIDSVVVVAAAVGANDAGD